MVRKCPSTFKPSVIKLMLIVQTIVSVLQRHYILNRYTNKFTCACPSASQNSSVCTVFTFYTLNTNHRRHINQSLLYTVVTVYVPCQYYHLDPPLTASADGHGGRTLSLLGFLQQLDTIVTVEFNSPPISSVRHQQGAELQTAFAVGFGGHAQLHNVTHQVGLHGRPLCLRPGPL